MTILFVIDSLKQYLTANPVLKLPKSPVTWDTKIMWFEQNLMSNFMSIVKYTSNLFIENPSFRGTLFVLIYSLLIDTVVLLHIDFILFISY